ncbi:MAG: hypothetical protein CVV48_05550 [Spirochaetae bacterium HGW-Spirochaetae-4]|nr:MAG: hypothetical protein CVV52_06465 [Spirochaetae bacterium HGW-Spirochaetae-8]PKL21924.1 MAG: hypothetical protein CVV48_05550 [Spirochaetae bacterium HGW-Spirochaetae-4]
MNANENAYEELFPKLAKADSVTFHKDFMDSWRHWETVKGCSWFMKTVNSKSMEAFAILQEPLIIYIYFD